MKYKHESNDCIRMCCGTSYPHIYCWQSRWSCQRGTCPDTQSKDPPVLHSCQSRSCQSWECPATSPAPLHLSSTPSSTSLSGSMPHRLVWVGHAQHRCPKTSLEKLLRVEHLQQCLHKGDPMLLGTIHWQLPSRSQEGRWHSCPHNHHHHFPHPHTTLWLANQTQPWKRYWTLHWIFRKFYIRQNIFWERALNANLCCFLTTLTGPVSSYNCQDTDKAQYIPQHVCQEVVKGNCYWNEIKWDLLSLTLSFMKII